MRDELADKQPYREKIGNMRLQLLERQLEDQVVSEIGKKSLKEGWEEIDGVLHYKAVCTYLRSSEPR